MAESKRLKKKSEIGCLGFLPFFALKTWGNIGRFSLVLLAQPTLSFSVEAVSVLSIGLLGCSFGVDGDGNAVLHPVEGHRVHAESMEMASSRIGTFLGAFDVGYVA
jgi:hypothetical protein